MAAIDGKKAEQNQWLPRELFPLRTHRIAASGRTYDGDEFTFVQTKGNVCKSRCFSVQRMIGVVDIFQF